MTNSILSPDATYLKTQRTRRIPTFLPGKKIRRRVLGKQFGVDYGGGAEGEWKLSEDKRGRVGR